MSRLRWVEIRLNFPYRLFGAFECSFDEAHPRRRMLSGEVNPTLGGVEVHDVIFRKSGRHVRKRAARSLDPIVDSTRPYVPVNWGDFGEIVQKAPSDCFIAL